MNQQDVSINDALKGIRVLDFTQIGAGPLCGMQLGDMGAEVIKVEAPTGDIGRKLGPPWQNGESVISMCFNRNKRSLIVDLKKTEGVVLIKRLAKTSDVILESFRPGVMDRLGIGYQALRAVNPKIIFTSISAYGQTGPWKDKPGVDGIVQAVSGLMSNIGDENSPPMKVLVPAVDMVTGFVSTSSVMAALRVAELTGLGQHLDNSLYNSAMMFQLSAIASYLSSGEKPIRIGTAAPYSAPNEAYPTKDGWIMIAAYHDDRWPALCKLLGKPELSTHEDFANIPLRVANRKKLMTELTVLLASKTSAEWQVLMEAQDIICGPIADYDMVMDSPQLKHNGVIVDTPNSIAGNVRMPGMALGDRDAQARVRYGPPTLGEHSCEVLLEYGLTQQEIDALLACGAVIQNKVAKI
jgi:crotonobetainyl-CoA:carnitine CoA-transferase CaiB-like acyl-CoA transferase